MKRTIGNICTVSCVTTVFVIGLISGKQNDRGVAFSPDMDLKIWLAVAVVGFVSLFGVWKCRPNWFTERLSGQ